MKIFIIGFGTMGRAIANALAGKSNYKIYAARKSAAKFNQKGIIADNSFKHLKDCDYMVLAVKPQDAASLAKTLKGRLNSKSILISIAAGVSLKKLIKLFDHKKTVRTIPSLTLTVGQGIGFWKASSSLSVPEKRQVSKLFSHFMENFEVHDENLIDAGSIIYGSGPAYFFVLAEALQAAAQTLGVGRLQSRKLVEKTFLGAALLQQNQEYGSLINKIASKKGITEAALKVFKKKHLSEIIEKAVKAGFKRTKELDNG